MKSAVGIHLCSGRQMANWNTRPWDTWCALYTPELLRLKQPEIQELLFLCFSARVSGGSCNTSHGFITLVVAEVSFLTRVLHFIQIKCLGHIWRAKRLLRSRSTYSWNSSEQHTASASRGKPEAHTPVLLHAQAWTGWRVRPPEVQLRERLYTHTEEVCVYTYFLG